MGNKEERILITKCSSWCQALRLGAEYGIYCDKSGRYVRITPKDCAKCKDPVLLGISRAEAIELMAKAIKSVPKASGEAVHSTDYAKWAEAALDALLEDKNGR